MAPDATCIVCIPAPCGMNSDVPQRPRGRTVHKDALKPRLTHPRDQGFRIRPVSAHRNERQAFGRGGPNRLRSVSMGFVEPAFPNSRCRFMAALERGGELASEPRPIRELEQNNTLWEAASAAVEQMRPR
jgi:hypothetical protein